MLERAGKWRPPRVNFPVCFVSNGRRLRDSPPDEFAERLNKDERLFFSPGWLLTSVSCDPNEYRLLRDLMAQYDYTVRKLAAFVDRTIHVGFTFPL